MIKLPFNVAQELDKTNEINSAKGPVFATAIIAGTLGCKRTSDLIPFCHPLSIEKCDFTIKLLPVTQTHDNSKPSMNSELIHDDSTHAMNRIIQIDCTVKTSNKTGVEMEALTGVSIAALTVYDMLKAMSHSIEILHIKLIQKTGGKSDYQSSTAPRNDRT